MQAIKTKYHGPTNNRGSRVKASCERGSLMVEWEHGLNPDQNHRRAAKLLLDKFAGEDVAKYGKAVVDHHWGEFITGEIEGGVCVHVLVGRFSGWGMLRDAARKLDQALWECSGVDEARKALVEALAEVEKEVAL